MSHKYLSFTCTKRDKIDIIKSPDKLLNFWGMEHVKINRARIFDWYIEICKVYDQSWQTFWMTRELMDKLIVDKNVVKISNIHLLGAVCFLIASKYHETIPLTVDILHNSVIYKRFTKKEIV